MGMNADEAAYAKELEAQIRQKECELHRRYSQMGKCLLEMAEGEQRVINSLVDEIIEARTQLVHITGQKECPACTAYNDAGSRFCKRCGERLKGSNPEKEHDNGSE